jgi:metal-responsive CopG/Arc/MetJ family transcriptional regulator
MAVKVTFTLDEATVGRLTETARRLAKPKSEVVREAIRDYHARNDRLSEAERKRMLRVLDQMMMRRPARSQSEVDREIAQIRADRKAGGRLHASE